MRWTQWVGVGAFLVLALEGRARADACWPWEYGFESENEYTRTHYPIVLAHGAFGFASMRVLGIDILDYWYDLDAAIADCNGAEVFVTQVSPFNSTEHRGEQLLAQVQHVVALTGKERVHLIAHSMGGLDARYVMNVRPDLVASVTTIGSPHQGGETFEALLGGIDADGRPSPWLVQKLNGSVRMLYGLLTGEDNAINLWEVLQAQLPERARRWNERYPAGVPERACGEGAASFRGIPLYSWTGRAAAPWTTSLNPLADLDRSLNDIFGLFESLSPDDTDGLVDRCSAHFGTVLRDDYRWNHADEVNLLWGITADFEVDPRTEFRKHANRLMREGL